MALSSAEMETGQADHGRSRREGKKNPNLKKRHNTAPPNGVSAKKESMAPLVRI